MHVPCLLVIDRHSNFIMSQYVHILFWRYKACCQRETIGLRMILVKFDQKVGTR